MENTEIISELQTIKFALIAICIILFLLLITFIMATIGNLMARKNEYSKLMRDSFVSEVQELNDAGKYTEMIEQCEYRISRYPDDLNARYFLGIALNKNGNPGLALAAFAKLKEIDPAWERKHVDEYIEDIRSTMTGPSKS